MKKIGFKLGSWGSTISKWEKSFFGGFYRMVTDHPRVVVDPDVDFDAIPYEGLAAYQREKILKIFLSKAKKHGMTGDLLRNAETVTENSFRGGKMIKSTLNKESKNEVIGYLTGVEKEYAPLLEHYTKLILNSDIYFKRPEEDDSEKNNGENDQNKNEDDSNDESENKKDQKGHDSDQANGEKKNKYKANLIAFENALRAVEEEEFKYSFISQFNKKVKTIINTSNDVDTQFTHEETMVAENLAKMLDISFDPTHDVVKNLRLGKLDITKIAEVPAGNIAIYKQNVEDQATKPFSVVILCDESGSMTDGGGHGQISKIRRQYSMVKSLYLCFSDILPQEKIFVYGHTGHSNPNLYVYQDAYNANFLTTIDQMVSGVRPYQWNYDGPIIEEIHKTIRLITEDRIIFIVMSDGLPRGEGYGNREDYENMKQIIEKCKRDDFVTVGVGIKEHQVQGLYQYSAIVDNLEDMPKKVSHLVNHVVKTEFQ